MMDPGQDLLLAALSESGICANDLFDFEPQDAAQSSPLQQVKSPQVMHQSHGHFCHLRGGAGGVVVNSQDRKSVV